jgi:ribosomal-protein-alanine N-acetyltransferase
VKQAFKTHDAEMSPARGEIGFSQLADCGLGTHFTYYRHLPTSERTRASHLALAGMTYWRHVRLPVVKLVPYQISFLEPFIEWRNQPLSVRHNPLKEMSKAELSAMLVAQGSDLSDLRKYETYRWFVQLDQDVVGSVSLKNISHSMGYGEIGYGIAENHHGKGIATEAVRLLLTKVFTETGLRKLTALVHDKNHGSCRVLEKLGFRQEGLLREHYLINGKPVDEILYGLLKHEWSAGLE